MGEVEHAHQPVDQRQPRGDQEVHRPEAEAGDREQDEGAQCAASVDAEQRADVRRGRRAARAAGPAWTTRPVSSTTTSRATRCTTARFCSTSSTVVSSADALERERDLGDEQRREPLRRLVDEQQPVVVEQRPADRDHLLLAARERPGALRAALAQLGEEVVDEVVARVGVRARRGGGSPSTVSPAKTSRSSGHVADAAPDDRVRRQPRDVLARRADRAARAATSPISARRVVVLPTPLRPSSAVTPPVGHVERDALQDVRLAEVDVQVAIDSASAAARHSASPRYACLHGLVGHDRVGRVEGEQRAVVHDGDPLGEPDHDLHVVLDHQHRLALLAVHRPDQLDEPAHVLDRDAGHRLVEQDHARVAGEQHRELELALVAVREHPGRPAPRGRRGRPARAPTSPARAPAVPPAARRQIRIVPPSCGLGREPHVLVAPTSSGKTLETWNVRPSPACVRR